jgi:hypothetical protein
MLTSMRSRRFTRGSLFLAVLLCGTLMSSFAYAAKKPKSQSNPADDYGPAIAMSPFEVRAQSMEFSHWIKMGSPHFVIYTDANSKEAARLLKQMEMVHEAAQFFFRRKALKLPPIIIVLPTDRSDWKKIATKSDVEWKVATSLVGSTRSLMLVQHDWQSDGLLSVWSMLGLHESLAMNLDGPFWFKRGVLRFFGTVEFTTDTLTIGKQGFEGYYIDKYGWMAWPKFFGITGKSPEFTKEGRDHDQFAAQCAMFIHHHLTSSDPAASKRLLAWAAYLAAGNEPTEASFKEIFQCDWQGMETQLGKLLKGGTYNTGIIRFPPAALKFEITKFDLPAREMRELFVLSQILNQNTKDSDASLDALLARGLKTELLRELLADACDARDRDDAYLQEMRTLIAGGSANVGVYANAAMTLFKRAVKKPSLDARVSDEVGEIRAWCNEALKIEPLHVDANKVLAWTEALAPSVEKSNIDTVVRICRALEGNAATDEALAALAVARWRAGGLKQARTLCDRLKQSSFSGEIAKGIATDLIARLDASPTGTNVETVAAPAVNAVP